MSSGGRLYILTFLKIPLDVPRKLCYDNTRKSKYLITSG